MYEHQITKKTKNITNSPEQTQQAGVSVKKQAAKIQNHFYLGLLNQNNVLQLQRTIGNRATARLLLESGASMIQAKLKIGRPGDRYEQEADDVANQVVDYLNAPEDQPLRREAPHGKPQLKPAGVVLQRQEGEEEELQLKPALLQNTEKASAARSDLEATIQLARGGGQPIEGQTRSKMGRALGTDFSTVKVHTDAQSDLMNRSLGARAFTTGRDIFFRRGEYSPGNNEGQKLLAHELTHVVQQTGAGQRPIKPIQLKTNAAVIQLQYADIDAWLKSEAKKDEKEALVGFFNNMPELKQKMAMYVMAYKLEIADLQDKEKGALLTKKVLFPPEPSKEAFLENMQEIKVFKFRKGVNWDRFSEVVRAVKDTPIEDYTKSGDFKNFAKQDALLGAGVSASGHIAKISGGGAVATAVAAPIASFLGMGAAFYNGLSLDPKTEGLSGHDQAQHYAEMGMSMTDLAYSGGSATAHVQDYSSFASGADLAQGAATTTLMGGAAIAGGAIALGSGVHGAIVHHQRQEELHKLQEKYEGKKDKESLARGALFGGTAENIKRNYSVDTAIKGAAMIAGGVLLAATAATGVGAIVITAAALYGGVAALYKWWCGKKRKERLVDKYLGVKEKLSKMETRGGRAPDEEKVRQGLLMKSGFNSVDQCYAHIVTELAMEIHQKGVQGEDPEYKELIDKLGMKISTDKKQPTVDQIAKKLHV